MKIALKNAAAASLTVLVALGALSCSNGGDDLADPDSAFPILLTESRIVEGSQVYSENCASCHGVPNVSLPPVESAPPHDEHGHTWHHADRLLFQWTLDRPPLAVTMPAFRDVLTEDQVLSALAYIKSTWPEDIQEFQNEGSAQYEQQLRENP